MSGGIVLAAGGTGGHMFPAQALAEELAARGRRVDVITDRRGGRFETAGGTVAWHEISAGTPAGANPLRALLAIGRIGLGALQAAMLLRRLAPAAVVGFGGYPSLPTMLAAWLLRLPGAVHEQNAVLGKVNRLLCRRVDVIASSFKRLRRLPQGCRTPVRFTGNPVRSGIVALAGRGYRAPAADGCLHVLVFGGSQGARVLSDVVPAAFAALPEALKRSLRICQQCREEDLERVRSAYDAAGIAAELATFFKDMPARLSDSQIIIARAGAGTVGEISVAGRPAILIPYAHAADDHQTANAESLVEAGGAWALAQHGLQAEALTALLQQLLGDPARLTAAAAAAASIGVVDAATRLADLVERLADGRDILQATEAGA